MKAIGRFGNYAIFQLTGIRTEYTGRPDVITEYYVAFDDVHFPIEAKTIDEIKLRIAERVFNQ
jgi:hypothetical protein